MAASVEEVAERLVEAFNARDLDAVLALVDDLVERQLFGAGYRATHGRRFGRGEELVAESHQELRYADTGELAGTEDLGVLYVARDGRLTRYAEFPDLASAFAATSVTEADEVLPS